MAERNVKYRSRTLELKIERTDCTATGRYLENVRSVEKNPPVFAVSSRVETAFTAFDAQLDAGQRLPGVLVVDESLDTSKSFVHVKHERLPDVKFNNAIKL